MLIIPLLNQGLLGSQDLKRKGARKVPSIELQNFNVQ